MHEETCHCGADRSHLRAYSSGYCANCWKWLFPVGKYASPERRSRPHRPHPNMKEVSHGITRPS